MKGINFKRKKDCDKIEYIKQKLDGTSISIKPAAFGDIDIIEFRTGREGGDFDTIDLELKNQDKFNEEFQRGEFLVIIPYYERNGEFNEMCRFFVGHKEDKDKITDADKLLKSGDFVYGVKGSRWCYQF